MVFKLQKFSRRNFLKDLVSLVSACSILTVEEGIAQKPLGQKYGIRPFRRIEFNIYNYWKDYDCDGKVDSDIGELVGSCKNVFQDNEPIYFRLAVLGLTHHTAFIKLFSPDGKEIFYEPRHIHNPNWAMVIGYDSEKTKKISESHGFGEYIARFYIDGECIGAKSFELVS